MKLTVRHAGGELVVPSQRELLLLFQCGVIAPEDLVRRDGAERWVPASELPWLRGSAREERRDGRRLFWITLTLMVVSLVAVVWLQSRVPKRPLDGSRAPGERASAQGR
jgi:hypothetical protein